MESRVEIDSPYGKVIFYSGMMITGKHYTSSTKICKFNYKCEMFEFASMFPRVMNIIIYFQL